MSNILKDTQMFLVMEDTMTSAAKNIREVCKHNLFYVEFDTVLQSLEVRNRNNRMYLKNFMLPSFDAAHLKELMSKNAWRGEAGHPMSNDPKRIMQIDPKLTSHSIKSISHRDNLVIGKIQTLDDGKYGTKMTKEILQGLEPSFSLRAMCPMRDDARLGIKVQKGKAFIITYDWVYFPSHVEAYRDMSSPIIKICKDVEMNGNAMNVTESTLPDLYVTESNIIDYIKDESKSIKLISSMYEIATESMEITPDMNWVVLKNGGDKVYASMDSQIKKEIKSYMKNII